MNHLSTRLVDPDMRRESVTMPAVLAQALFTAPCFRMAKDALVLIR